MPIAPPDLIADYLREEETRAITFRTDDVSTAYMKRSPLMSDLETFVFGASLNDVSSSLPRYAVDIRSLRFPFANFAVSLPFGVTANWRQPTILQYLTGADGLRTLAFFYKNAPPEGRWGLGHTIFMEQPDGEWEGTLPADRDMSGAQENFEIFFIALHIITLEAAVKTRQPPSERARKWNAKHRKKAPIRRPYFITIDLDRLPKPSYESSPSGRVMPPHNRRGHWCTSKLGKKFWRADMKIHGGSSIPQTYVLS